MPHCAVSVAVRFLCTTAAAGLVAFHAHADDTNLLANGDFEGGFGHDGVATEWTGSGTGGIWKANPRLGRIGGGVYGAAHWNDDENDWDDDLQTIRLHGKAHLVDVARFDVVTKLQNTLGPEVITVAKLGPEPYFGGANEALIGDPEANGREFADYCHEQSEQAGHQAHCYYGLNEPDVNNARTMVKIARFELGFTERLHEHGMRSCVLNNSTGTPGTIENMVIDEVRDLLAVADYVGYHCYGGPTGFFMTHPASLHDHSLRWRQYAEMYEDRGWRFPPVIYTEGTTWWGWHDDHSASEVRDDLVEFVDYMKEDEWAVGLNVFCTGHWPGQTWDDWCITRYPDLGAENIIIEAARASNRDNPVDARAGIGAQEILGDGGKVLDMGVGQSARTEPGRQYRVEGWVRHEFTGGWPCPTSVRIGIDLTGQTDGHNRRSVDYGDDLVELHGWETDRWYRFETTFDATGTRASVWLRAHHGDTDASVRVYFDDVAMTPVGEPIDRVERLSTY